ncbi:MAG: glycosyltransferase family 39 protein [Nitrospirota bacterium]
MKDRLLVAALLFAAAFIRGVYLLTPSLDSDEAVVGLMAIHILRGEYPIFYWGEPYCGPLESYLAALFFSFFGPSPLALNLAPAVFSLLFLFAAYRFARIAFGRETGLVSLLLLALGPPFLVWHSVLARGNYIENLFFGVVLMALVVRILRAGSEAARWRGLCIFAFLAGAAWWVSFQSVHFLLAGGLVLLAGLGRSLLDRRALAAVGFALLGSLLFWIYNVRHDFASLAETGRYMTPLPLDSSLKVFLLVKLPSILGMPMAEMARSYSPTVNVLGTLLYSGAMIMAAGMLFRLMLTANRRRTGEALGLGLLLSFTAIASAIIIARYNSGGVTRYFLVFYAVFPLFLALILVKIGGQQPRLAQGAALLLISVNVWGTVAGADALWPDRRDAHRGRVIAEGEMIAGLRARGLEAVFATEYWEFFRSNFTSGEDPVFAIPVLNHSGNKYPMYTRFALSLNAVPYIWHSGAGSFRAALRGVGAGYTEERAGPYRLVSALRPSVGGFEEISPTGWRVETPAAPEGVQWMLDGNPETHWDSGAPQMAGWAIQVDLGRIETLGMLVVEPGPVPEDVPARFEVRVSPDGTAWDVAVPSHPFVLPLRWEGGNLLVDEQMIVRVVLPSVAARFLEIRLTAPKPFHWRVSMLRIYRVAGVDGEPGSG